MKIVAWETTRKCAHKCKHCRASACNNEYPDELNTSEGKRLIESIASDLPALLILTGGEPLFRNDIFTLSSYASKLGIRVVMAPCGSSITPEISKKIKTSGISRISLSLDGIDSTSHDDFRGRQGSYDEIIKAANILRKNDIEFQINTTVTTKNVNDLKNINNLATSLGAVIHDIFLLVPTGRASSLKSFELSSDKYENTLQWIAKESVTGRRNIKVTCAPHYSRIWRQIKAKYNGTKNPKKVRPPTGCLAGSKFIFVSHTGDVQPCGFFNKQCGNIKDFNYDLKKTCSQSEIITKICSKTEYIGKCSICEFWEICKGCRARSFEHTGNFLDEEPFCSYIPATKEP